MNRLLELRSLLDRFEKAWKVAPHPDLGHFLLARDHPHARDALLALAKMDIEYRIAANDSPPLAQRYFHLIEGLSFEQQFDLVSWEYQLRWENGNEQIKLQQWVEWFPRLAERIRTLQPRWNCPRCKKKNLVLEDENAQGVTCPQCRFHFPLGAVFGDPERTAGPYMAVDPGPQELHATPAGVADTPRDPEPAAPKQRIRCPQCHDLLQLGAASEEVLCPSCGGAFRLCDARATETTASMKQMGKFQLLERIGIGGFGAVWKARDTQLRRLVALKIPHTGLLADPTELARFEREARAAAQLHHPNIVSVYEIATLNELPVIVSDFVAGVSLRDYLQVQRLTFRQSAALVGEIAAALEHAHSQGVVHRDIKPANIMLLRGSPASEPTSASSPLAAEELAKLGRPMILDFGLALRDAVETTMTVDGHVLGTPAYMSPEQASGRSHQADRRSDVYSLGVLLYELLTGELPFRGSRMMILNQILHEEPRPPRRINDKIPRDLETICLKCLEKDPNRRYRSASELANRLQLFLEGKPIPDRPVGTLERAWRWSRRNPVPAFLTGGIVVSLLVGTVVATIFAGLAWDEAIRADAEARNAIDSAEKATKNEAKANQALAELQKQKKIADEVQTQRRAKVYANNLSLALAAWQDHNLGLANHYLEASEPDLRGWEFDYLYTLFNRGQTSFLGAQGPIHCVVYSHDHKYIATGSEDGNVRLYDEATGTEKAILKGSSPVHCVAFSDDDSHIGVGYEDGTVKYWDPTSPFDSRAFALHSTRIITLSITSKFGGRIVAGSLDGSLAGWNLFLNEKTEIIPYAFSNLRLPRLRGDPQENPRRISNMKLSPDGKKLAVAEFRGTVSIWDTQKKTRLRELKTGTHIVGTFAVVANVDCIAWNNVGTRIVGASQTGALEVWDIDNENPIMTLDGHNEPIRSVAFSSNGDHIVSGGADRTIRVWSTRNGREIRVLKGHSDSVSCVTFNRFGSHILSGSEDRSARTWDPDAGLEVTNVDNKGAVRFLSFTKDGKQIRAGDASKIINQWSSKGEFWLDFMDHLRLIQDEKWGELGRPSLFSPGPFAKERVRARRPGETTCVAATEEWEVFGTSNHIEVWKPGADKPHATYEVPRAEITCVAISTDNKKIVSGSTDRTVRVWDVDTGKQIQVLHGHTDVVSSVAFTQDNQRVVSSSQDRSAILWDINSGDKIQTLTGHASKLSCVATSRDGNWVATGSHDHTVKMWDARRGREMQTFKGHTAPVLAAAFTKNGSRLVSTSADKTVKIWNTATGEETLTLKGHKASVTSIAISDDGHRLASGGADGSIKIWEASMKKPRGK